MESSMLKALKTLYPDKEYPSNMGQKWTDEEEALLLEELSKNMDIETISKNHSRTIGGINGRLRDIVYKMYLKNISIKEIIVKTKLDYEFIKQTIDKRQNNSNNKITEPTKQISLESEIAEMKSDIKDLKNTIKELVEMMKAVYEFEDA